MNIFRNVSFQDHYDTIRDAVVAIVRRAETLGLRSTSSWSLVELSPDEEDFTWLCQWANHLQSGVAKCCLSVDPWRMFLSNDIGKFSYASGIGTLLLIFTVEFARRNAGERSLWATICHSHFSPETQKVLFTQNHPNRAFKDAIELSVRWLHLRHVFGIEGLQNWYDTIYLQFGFTRQGFSRRLPEWLVGQGRTFAVEKLLAGNMRSATFEELWHALIQYRRKNSTENQVRLLLRSNPWILPAWIPELLEQARAKIHLDSSANLESQQRTSEEFDIPFLSLPRLRWTPPLVPRFLCRVVNLSEFDLSEQTYSVVIAGHTCLHLRRQTDGSYISTPTDEFDLPLYAPLLIANLVAVDGTIVQDQTLQLWDENEDVVAFIASTEASVDPWSKVMHPKSAYYLALAADLTIDPQPEHWYMLTPSTRLYFLEQNWPPQTTVSLEGTMLWQPLVATSVKKQQLAQEAIHIDLYDTAIPLTFCQFVRFRVTHPPDTTIAVVRLAGQPIEFDRYTAGLTVTKPFQLLPSHFSIRPKVAIELTLWVHQLGATSTTHLRYIIELPVIGVALLKEQIWQPLDAHRPLNLSVAQMYPLRFYLSEQDEWTLHEGSIWIGRAWTLPRPLRSCTGFGAPLKLQRSAYNVHALEQPPYIVAEEVISTGCVQSAIVEEATVTQPAIVRLTLDRPIEPDPHHTIVWWDCNGTFFFLTPKYQVLSPDHMQWFAPLPSACTSALAIAIAYNGNWLGGWWSEEWSRVALTLSDTHSSALALRWFHLPLLSPHFFADVQRFAFNHTAEALTVWLNEDCSLPQLHFQEGDDGWFAAMRQIFFDWHADKDCARLVESLADPELLHTPDRFVPQVSWKLQRINPLLMAEAIWAWLRDVCVPQWGKGLASALVQLLIHEFAEVSTSTDLNNRKRGLTSELATIMDVDSNFIEKGLIKAACQFFQGHPISPNNHDNIAVACQVEPFRRLLSIRLLELIVQQLNEQRRRV